MLLGLRSGSCSAAPGPAQGVPAPARPPAAELAQGGRRRLLFCQQLLPVQGGGSVCLRRGQGAGGGKPGHILSLGPAGFPPRQAGLPSAPCSSWRELGPSGAHTAPSLPRQIPAQAVLQAGVSAAQQ